MASRVSAAAVSSDMMVGICALAGKRSELLFDMKKTLLLIDGSSYLYRAVHALPDLRNAEGHPTGAMQGVISMLRRIREDYHADYLACIFGAKGKTFRDDIYADYKANRPPMPQELARQIEPLHQIRKAAGRHRSAVTAVVAGDVHSNVT